MIEGTVFLVDDDAAIRSSLGRLLDELGVSYQAFRDPSDFLDSFEPVAPACLVFDVQMPGMSGLELHAKLREGRVDTPVVFLTGHGELRMAVQEIKLGAFDFLEKPVKPQEFIDCVQAALEADKERALSSTERTQLESSFSRLTQREHRIVALAASGLTNRVIAKGFGVSAQAVDVSRTRAMRKLSVGNLAELIRAVLVHQRTECNDCGSVPPS